VGAAAVGGVCRPARAGLARESTVAPGGQHAQQPVADGLPSLHCWPGIVLGRQPAASGVRLALPVRLCNAAAGITALVLQFADGLALAAATQGRQPPVRGPRQDDASAWRGIARAAGAAGALVLAFALGAHWGGRGVQPAAGVPGEPGDSFAATIATVLRYHEASSSSRSGVLRRAPAVDWGAQQAPFKSYPESPHFALPRAAPGEAGSRSLGAMLRGPAAPGSGRALDLAAVGQLLHLTAGVTARRGGLALRAAPPPAPFFLPSFTCWSGA